MTVMKNFESQIEGSKPVVVDFYSEWSTSCQLMSREFQDLKEKVGDRATIVKMDIDRSPELSRLYGIQSVPTVAIFKDGKLIWRKAGITPSHEIFQQLITLLE